MQYSSRSVASQTYKPRHVESFFNWIAPCPGLTTNESSKVYSCTRELPKRGIVNSIRKLTLRWLREFTFKMHFHQLICSPIAQPCRSFSFLLFLPACSLTISSFALSSFHDCELSLAFFAENCSRVVLKIFRLRFSSRRSLILSTSHVVSLSAIDQSFQSI